jgi:hypothetical protein
MLSGRGGVGTWGRGGVGAWGRIGVGRGGGCFYRGRITGMDGSLGLKPHKR